MPRYFFDIHDDGKPDHDEEGVVRSDLEAVRRQAMRILPEIAQDEVPADSDRRTFTALVTDEDGKPVSRLHRRPELYRPMAATLMLQ